MRVWKDILVEVFLRGGKGEQGKKGDKRREGERGEARRSVAVDQGNKE